MSAQQITQLKKLARDAELQLIEYPDGRFLVVGGLVPVHWWPYSKRMTAYIDGAPRGKHYATAKNVINLAVRGEA